MRFSIRHCGFIACWLCAPVAVAETVTCHSTLAPESAFTPSTLTSDMQGNEMVLYADKVEYEEQRLLRLQGDVEMQAGQINATSERAEFNQAAERAAMQGNIRITGPQLIVEGDSAEIDLGTEDMRVNQVRFINPQTGMRGSAEVLDRQGKQKLAISDGYFTTCEGERPDWSIAASEITLDNESGFGTAKHARLEILDVPVLYVPWFTFPIDERRKSGFLYPSIGSANTGQGMQFSTPYYFNLAPDYDATLTPSFINGRGWHTAVELRHLHADVESRLAFGYLEDDGYYRDEQVDEGFSEPDGDRWGFSWEHAIHHTASNTGWEATLDFNAVSDNDYLNDLNLGLYTGQNDSLNRELSWLWAEKQWRVSARLQQIKQLDDDLLPVERNYQRLPEVSVDASQRWGNWLGEWHSRYVYFYRDNGDLSGIDAAIGSRLRHTPSISYPMEWTWASVEPRVSLDHTDYLLEDYPPEDNHQSRTLLTYEVDSSLHLYQQTAAWSRTVHHSLQPRLFYVYRDAKQQTDLPNFDTTVPAFNYSRLFESRRFSGGDRVGDMNRLSLGLQSHWYDSANGHELAQLNVGQILHFEDRQVSLDNSSTLDAFGGASNSSSFYAAEVLLRPNQRFSFTWAGLWDDSSNRTHEGWTRVGYQSADYRTLFNLSHRYRVDDLEQSNASAIIPVTNEMSLLGQWRYDLQNHRSLGTLAGLEYESCCWRVQIFAQSYLDDDAEIKRGIQLRFNLKGLGAFGANADSLDQQIPGYQAREENIY